MSTSPSVRQGVPVFQGAPVFEDPSATAPRAAHTSVASSLGTRKTMAAFCMVAGIAWNAGLEARPFDPVMVGVSALAIHVLPLVALIAVLLRGERRGRRGARRGRGESIAAAIALAFGLFSVLFSVTHPHAVMGIHNLNDVLPIAILDAGALLWLVPGHRAHAVRTTR
jgi:hypothetical protein